MGLLSLCISLNVLARDPNWKIIKITGKDSAPVGYMYETGSVGHQTFGSRTEKLVTGLRIICSVASKESPVIGVFWNTMQAEDIQHISIKIDKKQYSEKLEWFPDQSILWRNTSELNSLIQSLKNGQMVDFEWTDKNNVNRRTIFDLRSFNSHLNEFNTLCKIKL